MKLDNLDLVIEDVKSGKPVVIIDDEARENEGDLMVAGEKVNAEILNYMMNEGKGLICLSLTAEKFQALSLPMQVAKNTSAFGTNFGVSINYRYLDDNGLSAASRAKTILEIMNDDASADSFTTPGFVFPLLAVAGGVLNRRGQTEGSVDLARIAGLKPSGVICEIMDEKGEMLRGDALQQYCKKRKLKITSVEAIKDYRLTNEVSVRKAIETSVDNLNDISVITPSGDVEKISVGPIKIAVYVDDVEGKEHLAFIKGEVRGKECLVRIHSECLTGDVFGSLRCDCGNQFALAMKEIVTAGTGVLIYLHQEGRGIGLANKLRAYELQDQGLDTVDANLQLGFEADARDYRVGAQILAELGIESAILMTNNPAKLQSLKSFGVKTIRRVSLLSMDEHNRAYLLTKRDRMGHVLEE